jgi:hypothetical protein
MQPRHSNQYPVDGLGLGGKLKVDLKEVWRDRIAYEEMASEIKRQRIAGWRPWEILLPPEMLWPMLEEVSHGMVQEWSPILLGAGVQVGAERELAIRFVRTGETQSPVMVKAMPYAPSKTDNIVPIEVGHGNTV